MQRLSFGVTDDVGHGFANRQGENGLLCRAEGNSGSFAVHGDASGFQRAAGLQEFGSESLTAISANGFAHVGQRGTRSMLHVLHLLLGALRIAVHQLARELGLQGDERQGVSQQIVQVARNAFALGNLGQVLDFVLGALQLFPCTVSQRSVMVAESHQDNQQQHRTPERQRQLEVVDAIAKDAEIKGNQPKHAAQVCVKATRRRCIHQ